MATGRGAKVSANDQISQLSNRLINEKLTYLKFPLEKSHSMMVVPKKEETPSLEQFEW